MLDNNRLSSALCDMYDIRAALPRRIKKMPKDADGTELTIGDCINDVIEFLESIEGQTHA
jgi:hypothetical protein